MTFPYYQQGDKDSQIIRMVLQYKNKLRTDMGRLDQTMATPWMGIQNDIIRAFDDLELEFKARGDMDRELTIQWLRKQARYKTLKSQLGKQVDNYVGWAEDVVTDEQWRQMGLSIRYFDEVTRAQGMLPAGFYTLPVDELETLMGALYDNRTPLHLLLSQTGIITQDAVSREIVKGLALGRGLRKIGQLAAEASTMGLNRAMLIARTEIMRARRTATHHQYLEMSEYLQGWKRMANKATGCMACLALDGTVYPPQEPLEDHPNGQCTSVPWLKGQDEPQWEPALSYFKRLPEEEQKRRMGIGKFNAWKNGDFGLDDLVTWKHSDEWGYTPLETPLKDLVPDDVDDFTSMNPQELIDYMENDAYYEDIYTGSDLKQRHNDYMLSLADEDRYAINDYTKGGYTGTNRYLRHGEYGSNPAYDDEIDRIANTLRNAPPIDEDLIVWRGVNDLPEDLGIKAGEPWWDDGFFSTSIDEASAFKGKTKMHVMIPKGSNGMGYINRISEYENLEYEMLFARGSEFMVLKDEVVNDPWTKREVWLVYLGNKND